MSEDPSKPDDVMKQIDGKLRELMQQNLEPEAAVNIREKLASNLHSVQLGMKTGLGEIVGGIATPEIKEMHAEKYMAAWREFNNSLWTSTTDANHANIDRVITALRGAAALMAAEPDVSHVEDGDAMIKALQQRGARKL